MLDIDQQIFVQFPEVQVGVIAVQGVDNSGEGFNLAAELFDAAEGVRNAVASRPVIDLPRIACWRETYRQFGAKPKKYPSSIEAMVRRILKGDQIPAINPLVDLYNLVSLKHLLPVGGEDLDHVVGRLRLRLAGENEPPVKLLGRPHAEAPLPGEVIYADDQGAVCRRWNWREAERTCLSNTTRNAILVIEALPPATENELGAALNELKQLVREYCGGHQEVAVYSAQP